MIARSVLLAAPLAVLLAGCVPATGHSDASSASVASAAPTSRSAVVVHGPQTSAPTSTSTPTSASGSAPTSASAGAALELLDTLPVKGRAPLTGYTRDQFGEAWTDDNDDPDGHNGCDTRNDILQRDLADVVFRSGSHCVVSTGTLHDPYTGKTIHFVRGVSTSDAVQIDHVVALGDAWQKGAQQLSARQRQDLANDPLELLAVDGPTNEAKGDGDAATWLPPNKSFRCAYVARQVAVSAKYHLWVTSAEKAAIAQVLAMCPGEPAPTE